MNWKPTIKFCNPILKGVDGNNTEDMLCSSVAKENINECDDLESLPQPHGVGKDTAKSC